MTEIPTFVEHRRSERRDVYVAATLQGATESQLAITQNVNRDGALMLCLGMFEPGDVLDADLYPGREEHPVRVRGTVARATRYVSNGPWRCALALKFEEPLSDETSQVLNIQ